MSERAILTVQQGVWIDSRQLAEAGLHDSLEVTVRPGEISIRAGNASSPPTAGANLDIERAYPLIDESFRDNWESPGMADYDRYEELSKA